MASLSEKLEISNQDTILRNEEFPHLSRDISYKLSIFEGISEFSSGSLLSLRSGAHAVTLSGFAGGEFFPLPRSKGGAFPFLLNLDGAPTASAMSLRDERPPQNGGTPSSEIP